MTLQGVPTYGPIWDFTKKFIPETWHAPLESAGRMIKGINPYSQPDEPIYNKKGNQINAPRSIVNDALSVWGALKAKKDQEGLNEAEMAQFNQLNEQLMSAQTEFAANVGQGPILENVPTTIEDVAQFTETTGRPDMITTAVAEGGRIGYNLGGITEEQNSMVTDMLNKGMDISTISTITNITEDQIKMIINQINEAQSGLEQSGALENLNLKAHGGRIRYDKGTHPLDQEAMDTFGMPFEELNILQQIVVSQSKAYGGRIGAKEGGIMPLLNLGGMEKDYRQDGGFVPIGRREKADDVPARLSKNEFVFTADAVRAAGGGDIDQGAQRMYNVMKNLEAGGEISEQSQGKA